MAGKFRAKIPTLVCWTPKTYFVVDQRKSNDLKVLYKIQNKEVRVQRLKHMGCTDWEDQGLRPAQAKEVKPRSNLFKFIDAIIVRTRVPKITVSNYKQFTILWTVISLSKLT
jgi:hypothetical protein